MDQLAERYRANHARLVAARDRLQAAVDAGTATDDDRRRLDTVAELLTPVTVTAVDAGGKVIEVQRPRQFLEVDPDGQAGRWRCSASSPRRGASRCWSRGWATAWTRSAGRRTGTAEVAPAENGHYRVIATRDGFDVAVHAWTTDWRITFTGETPVVM
jgi:hypothetical protein